MKPLRRQCLREWTIPTPGSITTLDRIDQATGASDSFAKLCQVCSKLDVQILTHPIQPCQNPLPCSTPPARQFGVFLDLGSVDEIESRRSICDICGIVAERLDKEPVGLKGGCRIAESKQFCNFKLPSSVQPRDPSVTHFHLTETHVMFDTSMADQFQGPSLPWDIKDRNNLASHYILKLQVSRNLVLIRSGLNNQVKAKARSSVKAGGTTGSAQKEEQFHDTIGGRYVTKQIDVDLVRAWLQQCEDGHGKDCIPSSRLPAGIHNMPTFVIDVAQSCIADTPSECRYVALSYVWGSATITKHLKNNTKELRKSGSLSSLSLPATIRHSIILVHAIGERYLWVDSLCIVQDDSEMRDPEIKRMGSIYSKALFTIIAAAGDNANSGLPGVEPESRKVVQKRLKLADCELLTVVDLHKAPSGIDDTTWAQRAWTFQERVLSNRLLVFSEDQVYWSCHAATHSEERALEEVQDIHQFSLSFSQRFAAERLPWEVLEPEVYCKVYSELLSNYRQRYLTQKTDLVNAFSGVLEIFSIFQKDTFFWGLPESLFSYALTWSFVGHSTRNNVKVPIRNSNGSESMIPLPSWSWAAWSGDDKKPLPFLRAGDTRDVRPLIRFHIVDVEHKLVRIKERSWEEGARGSALWGNDDDGLVPLTRCPPFKIGQLRFWTMWANVRSIRRWSFQGPGRVEYILFPPADFKPDLNSTHYPSEIVDQDFIVIAAGGPRELILLAIDEGDDGVAYRLGNTEVGETEWLQVEGREWRSITLG